MAQKEKPEKPEHPQQVGVMTLVLVVAIVSLVALGGGGALGFALYKQIESAVTEKLKKNEKTPVKLAYSDTVLVKPLPAIVTNLLSPPQTFIRIEGVVLFNRTDVENVDALVAHIGEDITHFLRTLRLTQLEGAAGLEHLREDLNERAAIRSEGKVQELLLHTVVVE